MELFHKIKARLTPPQIVCYPASLFAGWCFCCGILALRGGSASPLSLLYAPRQPLGTLLLLTLLLTAVLLALSTPLPRVTALLYLAFPCFYGVVCVWRTASLPLALGFCVVMAIVSAFAVPRLFPEGEDLPKRPTAIKRPVLTLTLVTGIMAVFLISYSLSRRFSYLTPCYDFGIFSQMFYYMSQTLRPLTTCERAGLLSHFAVHVSPIYYLMLPFYWLIPDPATLLVLQVLVILSGVVPLWLLCRLHKLSDGQTLGLCLLYVLSVALFGGVSYDLHENKFLTPLLLWLLWALDRQRTPTPLVVLFVLLTLSVKEDAALYIIFIGLWLWLDRGKRRTGWLMTLSGGLYLCAVTFLLNRFGEGVMADRFSNVTKGGLGDLLRTALVNPALLLGECMEPDKWLYALCVLLPMGLLPLFVKKLSSLLLACPFVIVNLVSDYLYQHTLGFQYIYGPIALLFYLAVINLPHLASSGAHRRPDRVLLTFGLCAALLFSTPTCATFGRSIRDSLDCQKDSRVISEALATVPPDASVRASSMLVSALSRRREIYYLGTRANADYVVLDLRPYVHVTYKEDYDVSYFESRGYTLTFLEPGVIAVLKKP